MGISLNGLTPAGTYPGLIKTGDNTAISGTPKVLSDGNGNNLPMEVSTTGVNLTGSPTVNSVAIANTTQVAAKQDTLVSGTNIKTINGTSVLGSGNIAVVANPSGVSGAIQFSNGSAFASDAANLFWDDTNNRLGVGTNAPASQLEIKGNSDASFQISGGIAGRRALFSYFNAPSVFEFDVSNILRIKNGSTYSLYTDTTGSVGIGTLLPSARTHIQGSGSTSATTSLLVQNSAGSSALTVKDDLTSTFGGAIFTNSLISTNSASSFFNSSFINAKDNFYSGGTTNLTNGNTNSFQAERVFQPSSGNATLIAFYANPTINQTGGANGITRGLYINPTLTAAADFRAIEVSNGGAYINTTSVQASAILQADSTTRGFLPPRMTTTQKNAIASPAAGLVVYDSTTNKLCCYNGSTWNDLF